MNIPQNKAIARRSGFTLIEILLVVAAIAILAGIVIIAINPNKQLGDTRNAQRWSDVTTILNAVYQYSLDHDGSIPSSITTTSTEICKSTAGSCVGLIDLGVLNFDEKYLISIPFDPFSAKTDGAGYEIMLTDHKRIIITAPLAEQNEVISVSR